MEKIHGKLSPKKTLIIKPNINDFEKYFSKNMQRDNVDVFDYLKPFIIYENKYINMVFKVIRRLDLFIPIYEKFFGDWWKNMPYYERVIVFDYFATPQMMRRIKKRYPNVDLILWAWNTAPENIEEFKKYCTVYCFDHASCEKWGLNYNTQFYFETKEDKWKQEKKSVYFIGADKGRYDNLCKVATVLENNGISYKFEILSSNNIQNENDTITILQKPKDYEYIIQQIKKSACILEIVKDGQDGISLRALEALFFRKKLITNDTKIREYDFYKKKNIFILGVDQIEELNVFINEPYEEVPNDIKKEYTYEMWLNRMHTK